MMRTICMHPETIIREQCDYCDVRCPYFTTDRAIFRAINGLPGDISDGLKDVAHAIAIEEIEEE